MSIHDRFDQFLKQLGRSLGCSSFEAAFELLSRTLNQVEDDLSGVPYDPTHPRNDGRMYPPDDDAYRAVPGRADLHRYRSRQHNTYFSDSGALLIIDLKGHIVLDKPDLEMRSIKL